MERESPPHRGRWAGFDVSPIGVLQVIQGARARRGDDC